jgi:hypothetical protein
MNEKSQVKGRNTKERISKVAATLLRKSVLIAFQEKDVI